MAQDCLLANTLLDVVVGKMISPQFSLFPYVLEPRQIIHGKSLEHREKLSLTSIHACQLILPSIHIVTYITKLHLHWIGEKLLHSCKSVVQKLDLSDSLYHHMHMSCFASRAFFKLRESLADFTVYAYTKVVKALVFNPFSKRRDSRHYRVNEPQLKKH